MLRSLLNTYPFTVIKKILFPDNCEQQPLDKASFPEVVFIGDSIIHHWCQYHPDFFLRNNFSNRGICGDTSTDVLERFHKDAIEQEPRIIVLLCGTNDLTIDDRPEVAKTVMDHIGAMYEMAHASGITLLLCSLPPCQAIPWAPEMTHIPEKIITINETIHAYASLKGLPYADFYSQMKDREGGMKSQYTNDGCHPTETGYCAMEPVIIACLSRLTGKDSYYITPPNRL